jgi:hypothetical protein
MHQWTPQSHCGLDWQAEGSALLALSMGRSLKGPHAGKHLGHE